MRSLAEPFLEPTSDFAEIVFAILGVATKLEHRRIMEGETLRSIGCSYNVSTQTISRLATNEDLVEGK